MLLVSWAGLCGATSAIFALMATADGVILKYDLFHLVFCVVLFSIALQGTLLPFVSKKLHMIDETEDVLKTFTDYTDQRELQLLRLPFESDNPWIGKSVRDLVLPPDTILVTVQRGDKNVIPRGDTVLEQGDLAVLAAGFYEKSKISVQLSELKITSDHKWNGKTLVDLRLPQEELVVLILRGGESIVPQGDTQIMAGDTLVMYDTP